MGNVTEKEVSAVAEVAAIKPLNLLQRINNVRKAIDYIQKDKVVSAGAGGNYKAVTHDMVTAMTREHMVTHGIVCLPSLVTSRMCDAELDKDGKPKSQRRYEATYDFKFMNEDDPLDFQIIRIEAHAMDNADKAPGKALSYAKKYAVLKLFEIETGENEESRTYEYDPVGLMEHMAEATTYDEARDRYAVAKSEAMRNDDKDGFQKMKAVMESLRNKFQQAGETVAEAQQPTGSGFNPQGKSKKQTAEAKADQPAEAKPEQPAAPEQQPEAKQSAPEQQPAAPEKKPEAPASQAEDSGERISIGQAVFLRKKITAAGKDEAALCAQFGVAGGKLEGATPAQ